MGRKRSVNTDLPPYVHRRKTKTGERFYLGRVVDGKRKEIPLGTDYWTALRKAQEYDVPKGALGAELAAFEREYVPTLKPGTRAGYRSAIRRLTKVFGEARYQDVTRPELVEYIRRSSKKVRAKRDIACFSSFWNWAADSGRTNAPNPRNGIRIKGEGRTNEPATDEQIRSVYEQADVLLRDVLDLLYLTGADVRVVLGWRRTDIKDGWLDTQRSKTGARIRLEVSGELAAVVKRCTTRPVISQYIISDDRGRPVTYMQVWNRFKKAREAAGVHFELRAIRRKTASDADSLGHAQELLGHADTATTRRHYRKGEVVRPLNRRIK